VEVAIQYNDSINENVHSFVNVINTQEGGTHLTGFRIALTKSINTYAKRELSEKDSAESLTGEDVKEGLTAIVYVKMPSTNSSSRADKNEARQLGSAGDRTAGGFRIPRRLF
jgi:DNA gyrase subunit B